MADEITGRAGGSMSESGHLGAAPGRTAVVTTATTRPPFIRRVSWGAIIAGAIVTVSCQLLLTTLGLAIGMATVNPASDTRPAEGLATGAGIWWLVTGLVSLFIGGLVAGRMAGFSRLMDGLLHGLTVWGLTAVASLFLLTSALSNLVGGAVGGLQQVAAAAAANPAITDYPARSTAGSAGGGNAQSVWDQIKSEARAAIQRTGGASGGGQTEPGKQSVDATGSQQAGATTGDGNVDQVLTQLLKNPSGPTEADRQAAVDLLVNQAGMIRDEAQRKVQQWERSYSNAGSATGRILASPERASDQETRRTAQQATNTVTNAAIWAFVALLLGAIAAALGGCIGKPSRTLLVQERIVSVTP